LPDTLLLIARHDDIVEGLRMLAGFDADLAAEENRISGRIWSVLLAVHPALERAIGEHLYLPVGVAVLAEFGGPVGLAATTSAQLREVTRAVAPRIGDTVAASIEAALEEQTVTVPGAEKADFVLRTLARQLHQVPKPARPRGPVHGRTGPIPRQSHPHLHARRRSPHRRHHAGGDRRHRPLPRRRPPRHLRRCRTPHPQVRNVHPRGAPPTQRKRQTQTRHVPFAFASLREPASRAYYDRKRSEGKNHRAALICLARRRCNVLHAILKRGVQYRTSLTSAA
jgi:hypothetical protein